MERLLLNSEAVRIVQLWAIFLIRKLKDANKQQRWFSPLCLTGVVACIICKNITNKHTYLFKGSGKIKIV